MKTIYHPTTGRARRVPESAVAAWAAAGWRKSKPKAVRDAEKAKDATSK